MLGFACGVVIGWLHWRFYARFMQWSLLVAPRIGLLGLGLTTVARWLLTGLLFVAALRMSGSMPLLLVLGFAAVTLGVHAAWSRSGSAK